MSSATQPIHLGPLKVQWKKAEKIIFRFGFVFILVFTSSFSFPRQVFPDVGAYTAPWFEKLADWFAGNILLLKQPYTTGLISDSTGMYVHALVVMLLAAAISFTWGLLDKRRPNYTMLAYWFTAFVRYYLAMQLLTYGLSKVFKWQFYLPEPNTLYTSVGNTPRDLLFWSTLGLSRGYVVFSGMLEVITAVLLLFRRTYIAGALVGLGVMLNVVLINFCFDISVKLYSLFLALLGMVLLAPYAGQLSAFFVRHKPAVMLHWRPFTHNARAYIFYRAAKWLVVCLLVTEVTVMYIRSGNYNDDTAPRPAFHGAYDVSLFVNNLDTLPPLLTDTVRWRRVFVHRRHYFIVQYMNDEMQDFAFETDTVSHTWMLTAYDNPVPMALNYVQQNDSTILLDGNFQHNRLTLQLHKLDLQKLPALQNEFNWVSDAY